MAERNPTCIGRVRHVLGATVTVALDSDIAGITPLWEGRLQLFGQVGSLVQIPQGPVRLVASVTLVGIAELAGPLRPSAAPEVGERWLQVQLLGEVDALGRFHRGVSLYPSLDDPVHFVTPTELRHVHPPASEDRLELGALSAAPDVPFTLDAARLVTRHAAVVGSTGSGKTSAVATLVQRFVQGGWQAANVVVVDPHGEYSQALSAVAHVRSVLGERDKKLRVPYWTLPADDILKALAGNESATSRARFAELVREQRVESAKGSKWLKIEPAAITADTPIPFDINAVWSRLDFDNNATFERANGAGDAQIETPGDAAKLLPTVFKPYALGTAAPFKGPLFKAYGTTPDKLRLSLSDRRLSFFAENYVGDGQSDPLIELVEDWLGAERPVSVLDFSGVATDATDLAVGAVLQLIFELAVRSKETGIGRPRPVLIVLEEAHRYLGDYSTVRLAKEIVNKIAREGRKYGVGLVLVSQRPSELPPTALSQVGTVVALRLTNGTDQATVKAALPDSVSGLADTLPALRTGEAIVAGEAVTLPSRVLVRRPSPAPEAHDPSLESWRRTPSRNEVTEAVAKWRGGEMKTSSAKEKK